MAAPLLAKDLLQQEGLTTLTRSILGFCTVLDEWGAGTHLRIVAVISSACLLLIRRAFRKKGGVDWYALVHSLITGLGGLTCFYLDVVASETLTGTVEPLRSLQCQGSLTSLHRILPAITLGYSFFDLIDGFTISVDFALHGAATIAVFGYFVEIGLPELSASALVMEMSTVFLSMMRATFFPETLTTLNIACFVLSFFVFRLVVFPYIWYQTVATFWRESESEVVQNCTPRHFGITVFFFGIVFHLLDLYWFVKIVQKVQRKLAGKEKITDNDIANVDASSAKKTE